jgi:hypothetical protein
VARTWSEYVALSKKALARYENAQFQIGVYAAQAIPKGTQGQDDEIGERIAQFAEEIGVEASTLDRWRSMALFYREAMKFPPAGGFKNVTFSAYRELQAKYDTGADAVAALKAVIESGDPPGKSGRWTWDAISSRLSGPLLDKTLVDQAAKPHTTTTGAAKSGQPTTSAPGTGTTTDGGSGSSSKDDTPEARVRKHLQAAWNEIPNIDREAFGPEFEQFKDHVELALSSVKASQLARGRDLVRV